MFFGYVMPESLVLSTESHLVDSIYILLLVSCLMLTAYVSIIFI